MCQPFGGYVEGDSVGAELFHMQVTREQGIFSYRQVIRCWGPDYIAENIEAPSVVLHHPSEREFVRELRNKTYEYIGINFVVATFHKLRRITELIRKYAPAAKIILGGYGTVLSDAESSAIEHEHVPERRPFEKCRIKKKSLVPPVIMIMRHFHVS